MSWYNVNIKMSDLRDVYGETTCVVNGVYYNNTPNYINGVSVTFFSRIPISSGMAYTYRDVMNRYFTVYVPHNLLENYYVPFRHWNSNLGGWAV